MTVFADWKRSAPLPKISATDTEKMTHEDLMRAALGKLTFEELARIRDREAEPNEAGAS